MPIRLKPSRGKLQAFNTQLRFYYEQFKSKFGVEPWRVLFSDCDGTLADTMPLHWRAWQVVTARQPIAASRSSLLRIGRHSVPRYLKMLGAEQGISLDPLVVAREKEAEYLPLISQVGAY